MDRPRSDPGNARKKGFDLCIGEFAKDRVAQRSIAKKASYSTNGLHLASRKSGLMQPLRTDRQDFLRLRHVTAEGVLDVLKDPPAG